MERRTIPGPLAPLQRRAARAADWLRRRQRRGHQAHGVVLMYHRLATVPVDPWDLAVGPNHFDDQVRTLRRHADIVPLTTLRDGLHTGRRARPVVAITFDDGYVDNWCYAAPLLERHGFTGTVLVTPEFVPAGDAVRPTLRDTWEGRVSDEFVEELDAEASFIAVGFLFRF